MENEDIVRLDRNNNNDEIVDLGHDEIVDLEDEEIVDLEHKEIVIPLKKGQEGTEKGGAQGLVQEMANKQEGKRLMRSRGQQENNKRQNVAKKWVDDREKKLAIKEVKKTDDIQLCTHCQRIFMSSSGLRDHIETEHGGSEDEDYEQEDDLEDGENAKKRSPKSWSKKLKSKNGGNIDMSTDFSDSDEDTKKTKKSAEDAIKTFDDLFNESVGDNEISNKIVFNKDSDDESD